MNNEVSLLRNPIGKTSIECQSFQPGQPTPLMSIRFDQQQHESAAANGNENGNGNANGDGDASEDAVDAEKTPGELVLPKALRTFWL